MSSSAVHDVHMIINLVHRFVYFIPEAAEEYSSLGVMGAGGYFGSRSAPMGAVPDEVIISTFYNFSPLAVTSAMPGVWKAASPTVSCQQYAIFPALAGSFKSPRRFLRAPVAARSSTCKAP